MGGGLEVDVLVKCHGASRIAASLKKRQFTLLPSWEVAPGSLEPSCQRFLPLLAPRGWRRHPQKKAKMVVEQEPFLLVASLQAM